VRRFRGSGWAALLGFTLDLPAKEVDEIIEAAVTDPARAVSSGITLVQGFRRTDHHELRQTELAVIVVVARTRWMVLAMDESDAFQIACLVLEAPIVRFSHLVKPNVRGHRADKMRD